MTGTSLCWAFLVFLLCLFQQRAQRLDRNAECSPGESIHVGEIDSNHFTLGVEHPTAAPVGGGRVVDEFVADHVAKMSIS
jgi:hypothetical protein